MIEYKVVRTTDGSRQTICTMMISIRYKAISQLASTETPVLGARHGLIGDIAVEGGAEPGRGPSKSSVLRGPQGSSDTS